jgi:diguanylate cyclase (GGDEF)-like protein
MEYVVDTLSDTGLYFSGGWYDLAGAVCLAGMTFAPMMVRGREPVDEQGNPANDRYWWWASRLAAPATLLLPLFAAWSFYDRALPSSVWQFRVVLSLGAVVVFGFIAIVKHVRLERELAEANRELLDASLTDLLTGVRNRRFFSNTIDSDVQQVLRSFAQQPSGDVHNRDLVFYLIDIDHFKKVNDQFGHQAGDRILAEVAHRINSAARLSDAVIRWGGEEFLLISRYTDRDEAHILAGRVLESVGLKPYRAEPGGASLHITCSIGWAAYPWLAADPKLTTHTQVLALADRALYTAKNSGRNRAIGLLAPGDAVRNSEAGASFQVDGTAVVPVTVVGPRELSQAAGAGK